MLPPSLAIWDGTVYEPALWFKMAREQEHWGLRHPSVHCASLTALDERLKPIKLVFNVRRRPQPKYKEADQGIDDKQLLKIVIDTVIFPLDLSHYNRLHGEAVRWRQFLIEKGAKVE